MGTVAAYDMASIQAALGGSNPIGLNEYYRGGSYVPTTATGTVREPTSGEYFSTVAPTYGWSALISTGGIFLGWNNALIGPPPNGSTSWSDGTYTYFRGTLRGTTPGKFASNDYGVYRTSTGTTSINTGVPSSGTISIANLYGARNP